MQTAPPALSCLPGPLPNSRACTLDPDLSPRPHPDPWGHSASLSSLLLLYTDSRTTCLYGSYLYEPLDHRGTRKSSSRSTEKCQDQARLPELWLRSVQVPLHLWLPCACPMLPIFILCLLPKKESRQLPALGTWNHPRTVSSFQV